MLNRLGYFLLCILLLAGVAAANDEGNMGTATVQGRTLVYQMKQGRAIAEGDIDVTPAAAAQRAGTVRRDAAIVQNQQFRWPNGVIPFVIDAGLPNQERVFEAIQQWNDQTPVRFVARTNQADYVQILRDSNYGSCVSNLGRMGGVQKVILSDQCATGNVLHELGHVIGLFHEQSRPDRDNFIQLMLENLDKLQTIQFSSALPYGNIFQEASGMGAYDYGSIMHYGSNSFSRNGRPTTLTIPPGIAIGQTAGLSAGDVSTVRRMYGQIPTGVMVTSNPPGLSVDVDGAVITTPQWFDWPVGSTHHVRAFQQGSETVRYVPGRWNESLDAEMDFTVAPDGDVLTAQYILQFKLRIGTTASGGGGVVADPPSEDGFYANGTTVTVRAIADEGQSFQSWSGRNYFPTHGIAANPAVFALNDESITYFASFTAAPLTTITSDSLGAQAYVDGVLRTLPYAATWEAGSAHSVTIANTVIYTGTGALRRRFVGWSNGVGGTSQTVVADGSSTTITAQFQRQYYVGFGTNLAGAGVVQLSPMTGDGYYDEGTVLDVRAIENPGYQFLNWTGDLSSGSSAEQITVNDELVLIANLKRR